MAHRPVPALTNISPPAGVAPTALVLGGGLAGIAAALQLAESGWNVTLVEARASLGGRVFSFRDPGSSREVDNGQHVIVGACSNLIAFLERLGVMENWHLQKRLDVPVYDRAGRLGRLSGIPLPAPGHLLLALLRYPHIGVADKLRAVRGLVAAWRIDRSTPELDDITFHAWLRERGQTERSILNLWNVLIEGTLNDDIRDVSAAMGLMIIQEGLLRGRHNANVGYPCVPLSDAIDRPAARKLDELGVSRLTGRTVRQINTNPDLSVRSVTVNDGDEIVADVYISALPFWILPGIIPDNLVNQKPFSTITGLRTSPIVNVHLLYDRHVMDEEFCYIIGSPLQWIFNHSAIRQDTSTPEQALTVSISAAWSHIDNQRAEIVETIAAEMRDTFPGAARAELKNAVVVKQRNATFRCTPGAGSLRPGPTTASPNLFLAGEWTDTGWPSTMEGAVISGYNAVAAVMSFCGSEYEPSGV